MSFTSAVFLILFFPVCIVIKKKKKNRWQNLFLCLMSMIFYAWCGVKFLTLITGMAVLADGAGLLIEKARTETARRGILWIALAFNLSVLFFYKYLFQLFPECLNLWARVSGSESVQSPALPLGLSFYTFSILSYLLDVYWEKCKAQKKISNVLLYVLFFPKVIQGPIMRYTDFESQLLDRTVDLDSLNAGLERFIKGMVKKVMIADRVEWLVLYSFSHVERVGTISAWIGLISYLVQLYYDFSGYSDMAVGLGRMAGFRLPENFDHPYLSASVGEYWRRWHISLGEWFRDYVYMPVSRFLLEKNWIGVLKHPMLACDLLSLFAVWTLTGIWRGSGLKYFLWGMWYFVFIAFERIRDFYRKQRRKKRKEKGKKKLSLSQRIGDRLLVIFAFVFGQVIFRAKSIGNALDYWKKMVVWDTTDKLYFFHEFDNYELFALFMGIVFIFPVYGWIKGNVFERNDVTRAAYRLGLLAAAGVAFCYAIGAGYSAFLYEVF